MKTKKFRSVQDTIIVGHRNRSMPTTRKQAMSELASLEYMKASLERELSIWVANQKKTEKRLQQLYERATLLQEVLDGLPSQYQPRRCSSSGEQVEKNDENDASKFQVVSLEY